MHCWAFNSSPGASVSTDRITASLESWEPGGGTPYNGLQGEALPERGMDFNFWSIWKSVIVVIKKDPKD